MTNTGDELKKKIKNWLKATNKDREWLAKKCGIKKTAVDEWFKKRRSIPAHFLLLIEKFMEESEQEHTPKTLVSLPHNPLINKIILELEEDLYKSIEHAALKHGITVTAYCSLIIEWADDHQELVLEDILATLQGKWEGKTQITDEQNSSSEIA